MRTFFLTAALSAMLASAPASAAPSLIGQYRVAAGPDVAGGLEISADNRFRYAFSAGALDERAEGRWAADGAKVCLYTEPRPVPPAFTLAPRTAPSQEAPTLLVTWPNGRGIAGVDFRIGFDSGDPLEGYTQSYGWSMPQDDKRVPRWIELAVPMHGLQSPRLTLDVQGRWDRSLSYSPRTILASSIFRVLAWRRKAPALSCTATVGDMRFVRQAR